MAMKFRFSWTLRQETSVGLLPGIAGKILVQRGLPLSLLSRFQTLTLKMNEVVHKNCFSHNVWVALKAGHLPEGLFHVHPVPPSQGCCAASAGRGVSPSTCRPGRTSAAGSVSKARSFHPYVRLRLRKRRNAHAQFHSGHSFINIKNQAWFKSYKYIRILTPRRNCIIISICSSCSKTSFYGTSCL